MSLWCKKPHIHQSHVFRRIKISQTLFEKGHKRNNLVKLFQILTSGFGEEDFLRISSCLYSAKSLPPLHGGHIFRWIKISRIVFEKGHLRNIPVKLFPNRTRGIREEEFLRISSCPYSAKSLPPPWRPCFFADQNFPNNFQQEGQIGPGSIT